MFSYLETPRSVPETPLELIHNPFKFNENDIQQEESQAAPIEIEEEVKEKIIQKEVVHTGSVSYFNIVFSLEIL
jgi:hypothetical protein